MPTTVLWPGHDPLFPRAWSDRLDQWFADADLRAIDGVGHFVPVEAPAVFAAAIAEHLWCRSWRARIPAVRTVTMSSSEAAKSMAMTASVGSAA